MTTFVFYIIGAIIVAIVAAILMARNCAKHDGEYTAFTLTASALIGLCCGYLWPAVVSIALLYFMFRHLARFLNRKR